MHAGEIFYARGSFDILRRPRDIPTKNDSDFKPRCVGLLSLRGDRRDFLGSLPFDSLPIISSLIETKQIQFLDLNGLLPKHGKAYITWVHFFRNYDPNEY